MKMFTRWTLAASLLFSVAGCGTGSPIEEGVPADVDFSKSYSPAIPVGPITPGDVKKARAKEAKEAKSAPADADAGKTEGAAK